MLDTVAPRRQGVREILKRFRETTWLIEDANLVSLSTVIVTDKLPANRSRKTAINVCVCVCEWTADTPVFPSRLIARLASKYFFKRIGLCNVSSDRFEKFKFGACIFYTSKILNLQIVEYLCLLVASYKHSRLRVLTETVHINILLTQ